MIGEQFGNYRAVSLLGEGGMGAVYLAEHPAIGRRVAVKVLHKNYTRDEHLLARFLNEARAANAIRHPNIIEILDSGVIHDGTPFLVMELLEGESLAARIRNHGPLPIAAALDFVYQTASALGAAHAKGIVHRDLKPDNLFVVSDPHDSTRERLKVLDFGIAKLQQVGGDSVKTRTGTLMGTPIYMSPEQCRGTKAVDQRTDVYSLGVILYEMLVGTPPFVSEGFGELVNMHLNVAPPPPRLARPDLPIEIEAVVLKMLAKNPDERFGDMRELQEALKASGGTMYAVRGSSPELGRSRPPQLGSGSIPKLRDTTFSAGTGERVEPPRARRGLGAKLAMAGVAAAVVVVGLLAVRGRGGEKGPPAVTATAPAPSPGGVTAPPPPSVPAPPSPAPEAATATVRLVSSPAGARVTSEADGKVLGTTPLVLERPTGGALKLRIEKDGYTPTAREIELDGDHTIDLVLTEKPRPRAKKARREREPAEPAKL